MPLDEMKADAALRLAEWLADPAGWLPPGVASLPDDLRDMMAASPVLRPALNGWLSGVVGIDRVAVDAPVLDRLASDPDAEGAVALLSAPLAAQQKAARMLGAALWSDRIRLALLKADRDRLTEQLGADAMSFGMRRATVFARPLVEMGASTTAQTPVDAGLSLCAALLARVSPVLADLFRMRHPHVPATGALTDPQARAGWAVLSLPESWA